MNCRRVSTATSLGLDGTETYSFGPVDLSAGLPASRTTVVTAEHADGTSIRFECVVRVDTPTEGAYLAAGGILPYVLSQLDAALDCVFICIELQAFWKEYL